MKQQRSNAPFVQQFAEVQVENIVKTDILTRGFRVSRSMAASDNLLEYLPSLHAQHQMARLGQADRYVLFIGQELDKGRIIVAFALASTLTIGVCVGLGIVTHSAGLGASISAAVFALIAVMQVMVVWKYR